MRFSSCQLALHFVFRQVQAATIVTWRLLVGSLLCPQFIQTFWCAEAAEAVLYPAGFVRVQRRFPGARSGGMVLLDHRHQGPHPSPGPASAESPESVFQTRSTAHLIGIFNTQQELPTLAFGKARLNRALWLCLHGDHR